MNNPVELFSNLEKAVPEKNGIGIPLVTESFELLSSSIGWDAFLESSRLVQGKGSNPLKVLIKENRVIYLNYESAKFRLVS